MAMSGIQPLPSTETPISISGLKVLGFLLSAEKQRDNASS